jgi:WD40 repeat protein
MTDKQIWSLVAAGALGLVTLGIALGFFSPTNPEAAEAHPTGTPISKPSDLKPDESKSEDSEPAKDPPVQKPQPKLPRPVVLKKWKMPGEAESDGKGILDEFSVRALYFDPTGARLVTVSLREINCLEIASGKILATIQSDLMKGKYVHYHPVISADGRFVAIPRENSKNLDLYETATGRLLGTCRLDERARFSFHEDSVAFSQAGDSVIALVDRGGPVIYSFSTQTASGRPLSVPGFSQRKQFMGGFFCPPDNSILLLHDGLDKEWKTNPSGMHILELGSGQDTSLTAITVQPHSWDHDHPIKLSPDGTHLLVKSDKGELQICDWRANLLVFQMRTGGELQDPVFTPDGKRLLVCWHDIQHTSPGYIIIGGQTSTSTVELVDLNRKDKMAVFTPQDSGFPHAPTALAVSPDGRTVAVATARTVGLIDFQAAFGVTPLGPSGP